MKTAEWIAALRSGGYKQGRQLLCNNGRFCCLGVLADISGVPNVNQHEGRSHETYIFKIPSTNGVVDQFGWSMIPDSLQPTFLEDLDLSMIVPETDMFMRDSLHNRLVAMNDNNFTFSEIADYIEEVYNANK